MAFETELSNIAKQTDVISDAISAYLLQRAVVVPLIYSENLPVGTNVKKFRKAGNLVAEALAESTAYTFSANSEITQSTITCTAAKQVVVTKLTVEANQFTSMSPEQIANEQGAALARLLDDNVLTLFSGFTGNTAPDTGTALTVEGLMEGAYRVSSAGAPRIGANLYAVVEHKGAFEIKKQLIQSGAAIFAQASQSSLVAGREVASGYQGSIPGVDVFSTDGIPTNSSNDENLVFNPDIAFCSIYGSVVTMPPVWKGSEGYWWEISSLVFSDVKEWNDGAGCRVLADT